MLPSHSIRAKLTQMLVQVRQTDNPKTIKNFLETINDMMRKLQEEQKAHQEISDKMMRQCEEEDQFRAKEVEDATSALNAANAAKKTCDETLESARNDLHDLEPALLSYQTELARAIQQRKEEHEAYVVRKNNYEEAIAFLQEFIAYVRENLKDFNAFNSSAFVEKSEKLLRHTTRLGLLQHAVPVLVALASRQEEVPTAHNNYNYAANQDIGARLNDALNTLLKQIQGDWQNNEDREQAAETAFQTYKALLEQNIATLEQNIERTKNQIAAMEKCSAEEFAIITTAGSKFARNQGLKDSASKMCSTFAGEFTHATQSRLEEIQTIKEILAIIEKRFGKLPQDLVGYLDSVAISFNAYVNSTEFKKFVEYEQVHLAVNEHGQGLVVGDNLLQ